MDKTSSQARTRYRSKMATVAASLGAAALLAGCGTGRNVASGTASTPVVQPRVRMHGKVHGGQQPVGGATIQLYAVGTAGTGSASQPLLSPAPTTADDGTFDVVQQYQCPQQGTLTYVVATGGNPGIAPGVNNAAIALIGVAGPCNTANDDGMGGNYYTLDPNLFVSINEVTTVAAIYALAPFMQDYADIGSAQTPAQIAAIATSFTNAAMLADTSVGATPGPALPSSVTYNLTTGFPVAINTLANMIAVCINSDGTGKPCAGLFAAATPPGGTAPADTSATLLDVVANPGNNVTALFNMIPPASPFQPMLLTTPNDWTISLQYTGLGLSAPGAIAFDNLSNLWIPNATSNFLTEVYSGADGVNVTGASAQYSGGGLLGPQAIAVDLANNIWVANTAGSSVVELDDDGNILSGSGYTGGGIDAPVSIAVDANGNAWVANFNGNSITQLLPNGSPSSFSPLTQGVISGNNFPVSLPTFVAVDGNNYVWVSNSGLNTSYGLNTGMLSFDANGNPQSCDTQGLAEPLGIAFDTSGTAWVAANGVSAVESVSSGCSYRAAPNSGGGLNAPVALAVDGAGAIWVANAAGSISKLTPSTGVPLSPATGLGTLNAPDGIAIDASGSIWTANAGDNSLTEFIGLAVPPVATPIIASYAKVSRRGQR